MFPLASCNFLRTKQGYPPVWVPTPPFPLVLFWGLPQCGADQSSASISKFWESRPKSILDGVLPLSPFYGSRPSHFPFLFLERLAEKTESVCVCV